MKKITTWNINGLRAATNKGIFDWIKDHNADVICLQEIKAKEEQLDTDIIKDCGYRYEINSADRPGYSGVASLYKDIPESIETGLGVDKFDNEGRVIRFKYPDFVLFNIYFPNGGRDLSRVPYKLDFYNELLKLCQNMLSDGEEIILTGDFNTAHKEIDLKNPKSNEKHTGFLPEEREWIDRYLDNGFYDAFRELYPDKEEYSWWSYMFNARKNNVGWRIDYFLVTKNIMEKTKDVIHHTNVMGSDHCPVSLIMD